MNADSSEPSNLTNHPSDDAEPDVSPDGKTLLFVSRRGPKAPGEPIAPWKLYVMPVSGGQPRELVPDIADVHHPQFSPDGRRIAFVAADEIYVADALGNLPKRLIKPGVIDSPISWMPDSQHIVYVGKQAGAIVNLIIDIEGKDIRLFKGLPIGILASHLSWSPDGRRIVFDQRGGDAIFTMDANGGNLRQIARGNHPEWSPDGKQLLYSAGIGRTDIFVIDADGKNQKRLTNAEGDELNFQPTWYASKGNFAVTPLDKCRTLWGLLKRNPHLPY